MSKIYVDDALLLISNDDGSICWSNLSNRFRVPQEDDSDNQPKSLGFPKKIASIGDFNTAQKMMESESGYQIWSFSIGWNSLAKGAFALRNPLIPNRLSPQEHRVMLAMSTGMNIKTISTEYNISISTVHTHLRRVRQKVGLKSHEAVYGYATRNFCPEWDSKNPPQHFPNKVLESLMKHGIMSICNWQGIVQWTTCTTELFQLGNPISQSIKEPFKSMMQNAVASAGALKETRLCEFSDTFGNFWRLYCWPFLNADSAVITLACRLPVRLELLSDRERSILNMLGTGTVVKQIAEELKTSASTTRAAIKTARNKLGIASQEELVTFSAKYCPYHLLPCCPEEFSQQETLP
ncbi:MAG: helix-turn-helix transcriptional regulator [Planctomycetota bacterium]